MKINFVRLQSINICRASKQVFCDLNCSIDAGSMLAIIGPNGSGKTTILKLMAGLIKPAKGQLQIDDCSYNIANQAKHLRKTVGFAPDQPQLYNDDTIQNYLQFIAHLKQIPKEQIKSRIEHCLSVFALTELQHKYIHTLSKGMQQRINLAQAIIHQPRLVLLDEPLNGLDSSQRQNFVQYLNYLRQQEVTIIYTCHDYSDLLAISDYMLKINHGRLDKIMLPIKNEQEVALYDTHNC